MELFKILGVIKLDDKKAMKQLEALDGKAKSFSKSLDNLAKSIKPVSAALGALATTAAAVALKLDDAFDSLRLNTGATGDALAGLEQSFRNIGSSAPDSLSKIADTMGKVYQRTNLTGPALEALTNDILDFARATGQDAIQAAEDLTRMFGDWQITDTTKAMDFMLKTMQSTGAEVSSLTEISTKYGALLRSLGLDFEESITLIGKWNKEGVNLRKAISELEQGFSNLTKDGKDVNTALAEIFEQIKNTPDVTEASRLAIENFGQSAGSYLVDNIRSGKFEIEELLKTIRESPETLAKATEDTWGFQEQLASLGNKAQLAIEPLGKALVDALSNLMPFFEKIIGVISNVIRKFDSLSPTAKKFSVVVGSLVVALPLLNNLFLALSGALATVKGAMTSTGGIFTNAVNSIREFINTKKELASLPVQISLAEDKLREYADAIKQVEENISNLDTKIDDLTNAKIEAEIVDANSSKIDKLRKQINDLEGERRKQIYLQKDLNKEYKQQKEALAELKERYEELTNSQKVNFEQMVRNVSSAALTVGALSLALSGLISATGKAEDGIGKLAAGVLKWTGIIATGVGLVGQMGIAIKTSLIPALQKLATALGTTFGGLSFLFAGVAVIVAALVDITVRGINKISAARAKEAAATKLQQQVQDAYNRSLEEGHALQMAMVDGMRYAAQATKYLGINLDDIPKQLSIIDEKAKVLGKTYNAAGEKASVVRAALEKLIEKGLGPQNIHVIELTKSLKNYEAQSEAWLKANSEIGESGESISDIFKKNMKDIRNLKIVFGESYDAIRAELQLIESTLTDLAKSGDTSSQFVKDLTKRFNELKEVLSDEEIEKGANALKDSLLGLSENNLNDVISKFQEAIKGIKDFENALKLISARKEINVEGFDETAETIEALNKGIEAYENKLNTLALNKPVNATQEGIKAWEKEVENTKQALAGLRAELENLQNVPTEFGPEEGYVSSLTEAYKEHISALAMITRKDTFIEGFDALTASLQEYESYLEKLVSMDTSSMTEDEFAKWEEAISGVNSEISKLKTELTSIPAIVEEVSAAMQMFTNLSSNVNFASNISTAITTGNFYPLIEELISSSQAFKETVDFLNEAAENILSVISDLVSPLISIIKPLVNNSVTMITNLLEALEPVVQLVINLLSPLTDFNSVFSTLMVEITDSVAGLIKGLEPLLKILAMLAKIGQLPFKALFTLFNSFVSVLSLVVGFLEATVGRLVKGIINIWNKILDALINIEIFGLHPFEGLADWKINLDVDTSPIEDVAKTLVETLQEALRSGVDNGLMAGIKSFLSGASANEWQKSIRDGIRNTIIDALAQAVMQGALFKGAMGRLLVQLSNAMAENNMDAITGENGILAQIKAALPAIYNNIQQVLGDMPQWLAWALPASDQVTQTQPNLPEIPDPLPPPITQPELPSPPKPGENELHGTPVVININDPHFLSSSDMDFYLDLMVTRMQERGITV